MILEYPVVTESEEVLKKKQHNDEGIFNGHRNQLKMLSVAKLEQSEEQNKYCNTRL